MENKAFRCPKCNTKVTLEFVEDQLGRIARWWRCGSGHFWGSPHWQSEWEEPTTMPPEPDLEPWPDDAPPKIAVEAVDTSPRLILETPPGLTAWQFLCRALPAVFFAAISVLLFLRTLCAPHVQKLLTTLI